MLTLLKFAEFAFGAQVRQHTFEPLVADLQRDIADRPTRLHKLRWALAVAVTIVRLLPRATFGNLPSPLIVDLAGRAVTFATLAFALQWLLGGRVGTRSGAVTWPSWIATAMLFMVVPLVLRIRMSLLPIPQQRWLTIAITTGCMAAASGASVDSPRVGVAFVLAFTGLGFYGWRMANLGTAQWRAPGPLAFWRGFFAANGLILAALPIKLALGISAMDAYWPGKNLVPYLFGIVVGLAAWPDSRVDASGRQNSRMA